MSKMKSPMLLATMAGVFAAVAMAEGSVMGLSARDILGEDPKIPETMKDPNSPKVSKAEQKRLRKAEKLRRDHERSSQPKVP